MRTVSPSSPEYKGLEALFQNLVLNPGWYAHFCSLEEDAGRIKAYDLRQSTMDLPEWLYFLRTIKMLPQRLTKHEATQIFYRANRVGGVSDNDLSELNFGEFKQAMRYVAEPLGIDWSPMEVVSCSVPDSRKLS